MPDYTQADQPIRVDTALAEDVLLLAGFHGREEISQPFVFDLELLSEDPNLDPADLLRTPISIGVLLPDGEMRRIHGQVRSFGYEGRRGELSFYRAEMVPWLWFLSLSKDCRIFQNMSVPDILEAVFAEEEGAQFKTQFAQDYAEREYCVQYRESNLNFVSRLMEEEGIFYFFEHAEDGHTLVLTDYPQMKPCDGQDEVRMYSGPVPQQDVVRSLTQKQSVYTGTVTLADYDQLKPSLDLKSSMAGEEPDEIYEYQKNLFTELDDGERYARIALEREEAKHHVVRGQSTCRGFQAGRRFELTNHDRREANQEYAILEVSHTARTGSYVAGGNPGELDYENRFVAIPHGTSYRPPLRAPKPSMPGDQTAQVVGPAGEKINVDEHGRVKIQFHWDRLGSNDDNSSCWVRVSQNWAGKNWGGMFIPHVDQEVIVSFLEGDPDRPIITGRVYNAEHMPPQNLPANKHKSIIEDDYGNELVFDATPGDEHIRLRSPSHESYLELGKSSRLFSESNAAEVIMGWKTWITKGLSLSGSIGAKVDFEFGGSLKAFAGFKGDISFAQSFEYSRDKKVKMCHDEEFEWTGKSFRHHIGGQALLKSENEILMIGGGGASDHSGAYKSNGLGVSIQYGKDNSDRAELKNERQKMRKVTATVLAGLGTSLTGAAAMSGYGYKKGEGQGVGSDLIQTVLFGGALSQVPRVMDKVMGAAGTGKKDSPDPYYDKVYSELKLGKYGAFINTQPGEAPLSERTLKGEIKSSASLNLSVVESQGQGGVARMHGRNLAKVESLDGDVEIAAKGTVSVNSKLFDVTGSNKVKIMGKSIDIG